MTKAQSVDVNASLDNKAGVACHEARRHSHDDEEKRVAMDVVAVAAEARHADQRPRVDA